MKKLKYLFLSLLILLTPFSAQAAEFQSGEKVFIGSDKTENTYLAGAILDVSANITGDLIAGGAMISVNGDIDDEAIIAGSQVELNGNIGGDLRAAASVINLDSTIAGEALVGGSVVRISKDSTVGGEAKIGGALIVADGTYSGPVTLAGEEVIVLGTLQSDVKIMAEKITFEEGASIAGNLEIESPTMPEIPEGIVSGEVTFTEKMLDSKYKNQQFNVESLIVSIISRNATKSIALFVTALFFLFFFNKLTTTTVEEMRKKFWKSAGIGFLVQIGLGVAALILLLTIVGGGLSMLFFSAWGVLHYVARAIAAVFLGSFILMKWHNKHKNSWFKVLIAFVGAVAVFVLSIIPVIGWIVLALVLLAAAGSFAMEFSEKVLKKQ